MRPRVFQIALPILCLLMVARVSAQSDTLSNDAVISMVAAKLPKDLIVAKIKSTPARFDVSATGLVSLNNAKVSKELIKLMMDYPHGGSTVPAPTPTPAITPVPPPVSTRDESRKPGVPPPASEPAPKPALAPPPSTPATGVVTWKDQLSADLESTYVLAHVTSDRLRISKQGTALWVLADGISASPGADASYLVNHYKDGSVEQAHGLAASLANKNTNRDYRAGEKVYPFKISIHDNDIQIYLISAETSQIMVAGNSQQTRYKAVLQFEFPKGKLNAMDAAAVRRTIAEVFSTKAP